MKVLVVDDESGIIDMTKDFLEEGFKNIDVSTAANGAEALHLCSKQAFDLICTDYRMPVMNGLELIHFLRREPGPNQSVSIIFISAYIEEFRIDAQLIADVYFVEKPSSREHFLRVSSLAMRVPLQVSV